MTFRTERHLGVAVTIVLCLLTALGWGLTRLGDGPARGGTEGPSATPEGPGEISTPTDPAGPQITPIELESDRPCEPPDSAACQETVDPRVRVTVTHEDGATTTVLDLTSPSDLVLGPGEPVLLTPTTPLDPRGNGVDRVELHFLDEGSGRKLEVTHTAEGTFDLEIPSDEPDETTSWRLRYSISGLGS